MPALGGAGGLSRPALVLAWAREGDWGVRRVTIRSALWVLEE